VRSRLTDILQQYELRERHFECVIRSKELEVLLSRARAAEQKQLAEGEKARAERVEEEARHHLSRFPWSILNIQLIPRSNVISVLEPATSKGVGRRAEGSDDAIRAADIVLQRGTLVSHNPSSPPTHARAFARIHILSRLSLVVLSDRHRTFTAQRRAHATLIHFSSRRAGEERWQGPESGRQHCEWDRLTLQDVVKYQCTLTTRTPFLPPVDQLLRREEGKHTDISQKLKLKQRNCERCTALQRAWFFNWYIP
jgi:hypothetical protein